MRSNTVVDIAVLGGGPAGAFAAALLARRGQATVLVDTGRRQRKTSEWLSARGAAELQIAGLGQVLVRAGAVPASRVVVHGGASVESAHEPGTHQLGNETLGHAWLLDRGRFDQALRESALAEGCSIMTPYHATEVVQQGSAYQIETFGRDGVRTILARHVVDATGAGPRRWRSRLQAPTNGQARCYQLWMTDERADGEPELRVFADGGRMLGYYMTGGGHRSVWAIVNERPQPWMAIANELQRMARNFCEPLVQLPSRSDGARRATWCLREERIDAVVPGVLAIGDATQVVDVATGRGLEQALATATAVVRALTHVAPLHRTASAPPR